MQCADDDAVRDGEKGKVLYAAAESIRGAGSRTYIRGDDLVSLSAVCSQRLSVFFVAVDDCVFDFCGKCRLVGMLRVLAF